MNIVTIKIHDNILEDQVAKELKKLLEDTFTKWELEVSGKRKTIRLKSEEKYE